MTTHVTEAVLLRVSSGSLGPVGYGLQICSSLSKVMLGCFEMSKRFFFGMLQDLYAQICSAHMACWRLLEVHPCACLHAVKHWREALRNFLQTPEMTHGELGFIVHGNFSSNLGGPQNLLGTLGLVGIPGVLIWHQLLLMHF